MATAIRDPQDGIRESVVELQRRRDVLLDELAEFRAIPPHGGWSLLVDVAPHGIDGPTASARLLEAGIAATAMTNWGGEHCNNYVRLVFSNEPVTRLTGIGEKFRRAIC